ncbi:MAG: hypothetical protein LBQ71_16070 [Hungatella sp.]|jgi:hypothetical protein|nr:hypothetical protein [Hungatella sp.]
MNTIKKFSYLSCLCLFVTLAAAQTSYAADTGKVASLEDRITPDGEDGIITQTINAKTNESGEVIFPIWKDAAIEHSFKAKNTTPVSIDSYQMKIAVPKGKELLNIVDYSDKKPFTITSEDGYTFGGFDFGKVAPGKESKLALNVFTRKSGSSVFLWIIIILLSAGFMYRNLDLLKKPVNE